MLVLPSSLPDGSETCEIDAVSAECLWSQCRADKAELKHIQQDFMNPSEYIELKYPVVRYPGFSITHNMCLPLTLGNSGMTVVTQFY